MQQPVRRWRGPLRSASRGPSIAKQREQLMSKKNPVDNLTNAQQLVASRPPTLAIKSKVKAAVTSLNHNETPTKARGIKAKRR
jgi:hypothetical protein